jgi:hypothetical protein
MKPKAYKLRSGLYELTKGKERAFIYCSRRKGGLQNWIWRLSGGRFTESVRSKLACDTKNDCIQEVEEFIENAAKDSVGRWRIDQNDGILQENIW